ncbi:hypothetical protein FH972_022827 [Carpinus fangiana]|uniref:Uncharacterized protein n=1 Tax=Carpinus fangiana TaxID=176857 RepID=A0A5N6KTE5_9ROSI|nr:hypothetical protein FH972_022827 [Carpinus fangiana]
MPSTITKTLLLSLGLASLALADKHTAPRHPYSLRHLTCNREEAPSTCHQTVTSFLASPPAGVQCCNSNTSGSRCTTVHTDAENGCELELCGYQGCIDCSAFAASLAYAADYCAAGGAGEASSAAMTLTMETGASDARLVFSSTSTSADEPDVYGLLEHERQKVLRRDVEVLAVERDAGPTIDPLWNWRIGFWRFLLRMIPTGRAIEARHGLVGAADLDLHEESLAAVALVVGADNISLVDILPGVGAADDVGRLLSRKGFALIVLLVDVELVGASAALETMCPGTALASSLPILLRNCLYLVSQPPTPPQKARRGNHKTPQATTHTTTMADADQGATPRELLLEAARRNNTSLLDDLLATLDEPATAALINAAADGTGLTALLVAAKYGAYDVIDTLLDQPMVETDPRAPASGDTPLHLAVEFANTRGEEGGGWAQALAMVDILLDAGCDPRLRNRSGSKPVDTVEGRNVELKAVLRRGEMALDSVGDVVDEDAAAEEEGVGGHDSASDDEA